MKSAPFTVRPYGPNALTLEWPARVDEEVLDDILHFAQYLGENHLKDPNWEFIPVYHTLTLVNRMGTQDLSAIANSLEGWYSNAPGSKRKHGQVWELPVCYEAPFSMDLEETAARLELEPQELVEQHASRDYRVFGIGFLPGFLYLGGVPDSLKLPRRDQPRLRVPAGSVGLAAAQTGIYPQTSPGGWHIIGNCPVPLFDPKKDPPCLVRPGDYIRFRAVTHAEYDLHKLQSEVGIYKYKKSRKRAKNP